MIEALNALNSVSPLGLAVLLGIVIYMLVKSKSSITVIRTNHLHELSEKMKMLGEIKDEIIKSREVAEKSLGDVKESLAWIKARINGKQ